MKVNLLIIGAGRSGTTTLYEHLKVHPDICFSNIKEIPFFSVKDIYQRGESYYHSFFKPEKQKVIASSDTYLLIDQEAPEKIQRYNPNIKIIILMREPVERAYSSYIYAINNGHEKKGICFLDKIEKEKIEQKDIITQNNLGHFYTGLYYKHIKHWMQFFPEENFLFLKTEDLKKNYQEVLNKINLFLNIPDFQSGVEIKTNKASGVKLMFLHRFLINRNNILRKTLRKIFPDSVKKIIFNSGLIEKIIGLNKKQTFYKSLSENDRKIALKYFEEDLKKLKNEFNITF